MKYLRLLLFSSLFVSCQKTTKQDSHSAGTKYTKTESSINYIIYDEELHGALINQVIERLNRDLDKPINNDASIQFQTANNKMISLTRIRPFTSFDQASQVAHQITNESDLVLLRDLVPISSYNFKVLVGSGELSSYKLFYKENLTNKP